MKIWLITDTHWNHSKIVEYENRPLDFNELIIKNWQELVGDDDLVVHLGDVIFKKAGTLLQILASLPGLKFLCRGNHDNESMQWYIDKGFKNVKSYYILGEHILLSHIPMDIAKIEKEHNVKIAFNIHGHFHSKKRDEIDRSPDGYPFYSDKHVCLSIENENYKPVLLEEFLLRIKNEQKVS